MSQRVWLYIGVGIVLIAAAIAAVGWFLKIGGQNTQGQIVIASDNASSDEEVIGGDGVPSVAATTTKKAASSQNGISAPALSGTENSGVNGNISYTDTDANDTSNATATSGSGASLSAPISNNSDESAPASLCSFSFPSQPPALSRTVIFNEIAWMGSMDAPNGEWLELKNISANDIALAGWQLVDASGKLKVAFTPDDSIPAGGLMLLARASTTFADGTVPAKTYSGSLRNAGDDLALVDPSCNVSDFVQDSASGWQAGDNTTKQTMERAPDGIAWQTSPEAGGSPGKENSVPPPPASFKVVISFEGSGSATVTSNPVGMTCGSECTGTYASGTKLSLSVIPASGTVFAGWSGACYGDADCALTVTNDTEATAQLASTAMELFSSSTDDAAGDTAGTVSPSPTSTTTAGPSDNASLDHLVIAAVQIAGTEASNDFVKIYNPTSAPVDASGWKLHKKSSTGSDASIREFPSGTIVPAQGYLVWANSADGFAASIGADLASTQTLAADNSVALLDANGTIVDAVAWGTGTGQYGEGPPYPTDPAAGQVLVRRLTGGVMTDTGSNADDFTLQ